jgi:hypothetical protein
MRYGTFQHRINPEAPLDSLAFPFVLEEDTLDLPPPAYTHSFLSLSDSILAFMISEMRDGRRTHAESLRQELRERGVLRDSGFDRRAASRDPSAIALYTFVRLQVNGWLRQFIKMPTLEDTPSPNKAKAVYNLGRFVALHKRPELKCLSGSDTSDACSRYFQQAAIAKKVNSAH